MSSMLKSEYDASADVESRRLTVGDGRALAYLRIPGDDPVLLIHGYGSTAHATWEATGWFDVLAEAGRGALAPDLAGHGGSSKPHDPERYRPEVLVRDLCALLDAEHQARVDVIGYSMGAQLARAFARDEPGRIRRLVLGGIGSVDQFTHWGLGRIRTVFLEGAHINDPVGDPLLHGLLQYPGADPEALYACAAGMLTDLVDPEAAPMMPTLVVAGDVDPVALGAAGFAERIGAAYVAVPGRNHVTTLRSRTFKEAALGFLDTPARSH